MLVSPVIFAELGRCVYFRGIVRAWLILVAVGSGLVGWGFGGVTEVIAQARALPPAQELADPPLPSFLEAGRPYFTEHFEPLDYGAQQQNWDVVQDSSGVVYAANLSGVLAYDGVRWRLIRTTTDAWVLSLGVGADDRVYVGAWGDIGFLEPDGDGTLQFRSLIRHVPDDERMFEHVWNTLSTPDGVYFQMHDRLFRWDGEDLHIWKPETMFHTAFVVGDEFYVRASGEGLLRMEGDSLRAVPGGEQFAKTPIYMMVPYGEGQILVGTRKQGLLVYDGRTFEPLPTEVDQALREYRLYHGTTLPGGYFALATLGGGVFVIDQDGALVNVIDQRGEIPDGVVNRVMTDAQGGLWMALNSSGLARVDSPSQLTLFDERAGLRGIVNNIKRHAGSIYVATGAGVFRMEPEPPMPGTEWTTRFVQVPGISRAWALLSVDDALLVASEGGIYAVQDERVERVSTGQAYALRASTLMPGKVLVGLDRGLAVISPTASGWQVEPLAPDMLDEEVRSIAEASDGTIWMSGIDGRVTRLAGIEEATLEIDTFGPQHGLPTLPVHAISMEGEPIFTSLSGVYRYVGDRAERFVHDVQMIPEEARNDSLLAFVSNATGDLWLAYTDRLYVGREEQGAYRFKTPPALHLPMASYAQILSEESGVVWIGNGAEVLRYDPNVNRSYAQPYPAQVRRVTDLDGRYVYYGGHMSSDQREAFFEEGISYDNNALRVEYAAATFNDPLATEYQYMLEGWDRDWSAWTRQTQKTYAGLREGAYRFRVRARNQQGVVSREAVLGLQILAPWYRTWWAFLLYGLTCVAGVLLARRYHTVVRENKKAQSQVAELARERVVNERLQQANQRLQEANESLKQANKLKDEFLANTSHELRTPLTAILGFTSVLQEEVEGEHYEFLELINANGKRLLLTVNSLLDLAKIRAGMVQLRLERVDAAAQVFEVARALEPLAQEKGLSLVVHRPPDPITAMLDAHYFDRILYNIIGNAIKFTDEGSVAVQVTSDGETLHISVQDTGIGISDDFMPHLFKEFKQESTGLGRLHEGSGLGLAITAHLIELMDGSITVESTKDVGSTFRLALPVWAPAEKPLMQVS